MPGNTLLITGRQLESISYVPGELGGAALPVNNLSERLTNIGSERGESILLEIPLYRSMER